MKTKNQLKTPLRPIVLAISLAFMGAPSLSHAATFTVTNTSDDINTTGSLRWAVNEAEQVVSDDIIEISISAGSLINLGSELVITDSITFNGPVTGDASSIILYGGGVSRIINGSGFPSNSGKSIILNNMTLSNGHTSAADEPGGAVFVKNAALTLNHSVIKNSTTAGENSKGGGVYVKSGDLTVTKSVISGCNTTGINASGGGISIRSGNFTLTQSIISGNMTTGLSSSGGGIKVLAGDGAIIDSTISENSITGLSSRGGGLNLHNGSFIIMQSTISGNETSGSGSGAAGLNFETGDLSISQSTISANKATAAYSHGGIAVNNGSIIITQSTIVNNTSNSGAGGLKVSMNNSGEDVTLKNTILSGNTSLGGNFVDTAVTKFSLFNAYNTFFGDPLAEINGNTTGSFYNPTPFLEDLQFNGGFTQTHKPKPTSLAINNGDNALISSINTDQRGKKFPRIHGLTVDIGALEVQNLPFLGDPAPNLGEILTRRDMVREFLKISHGLNYKPPLATGNVFDDVNIGDVNADWIEQFSNEGYTEGCAVNKFCPNSIVKRDEMTRIFLRFWNTNPSYSPPLAAGSGFNDLAQDGYLDFIVQMEGDNQTSGCTPTNDKFCPKEPVKRQWFNLLLGEF